MSFLSLFRPVCEPVTLDPVHHYAVFSVPQWKDPNLQALPRATEQRFAVLYQPFEKRFAMETLEQAYIQGAMSGVKLVALHKNELCLFLSDDVAAATFPALESLWEPIKGLDLNRNLWVDFFCEHEVLSGRCKYPFWRIVKEIIASNILGIEEYATPVLHDCAYEISLGDDPKSHQFHVDICPSPRVNPPDVW
ncbi:hypothetical protein [Pseudomonas sp. NFACC08-1]|uniref:hypothetical protein n=1 Tax=Pseudomonas sp. NFACC08-1 TaxID=1566238 RepID=UPI000894605B|nr:hypothetical protein [Pseudomonas sp. NFACC08-1]SDY04780.1 hypothetical protein SAMN03159474_04486 [Pseudomonas sp. NFACC08-1]